MKLSKVTNIFDFLILGVGQCGRHNISNIVHIFLLSIVRVLLVLLDVAVVEYGTVDSGISGKELIFVRNGVWAVESELARDKRQALFDFNKLVLAATDNKLFVGPRVGDEEDYLRVLGEAAQHCTGRVYVALIPHPDEWPEKGSQDVLAWAWEAWGLVAIP